MNGGRLFRNAASTQRFAARFAKSLKLGQVVALVGDLGAGKTTFVQGLARGLGVRERREVLSPTYTLINEYPAAQGLLVHIDLYRLARADEVRALGLDEQLIRSDAVVVVEWADRQPELFDAATIWVHLKKVAGGRQIEVSAPIASAPPKPPRRPRRAPL